MAVCASWAREAIHYGSNGLELAPLGFFPGKGFVRSADVPEKIWLHIPNLEARSISVAAGVQLVCFGHLHENSKAPVFQFTKQCTVHFRPDMDASFAWDCTHMFSGSFCGWHQAVDWIPNAGVGFLPGRQLFIDNDAITMKVCATQNEMRIVKCPLDACAPWDPANKLGILGDVADSTIPFVHRSQLNLLCTLSPPCQTRSRGGRAGGLSEANGMSFIDALKQAFILQPILAFTECAAEIRNHAHFPIVQSLAVALGFKTLWTQVMPFHELSHHHRSRYRTFARWHCTTPLKVYANQSRRPSSCFWCYTYT